MRKEERSERRERTGQFRRRKLRLISVDIERAGTQSLDDARLNFPLSREGERQHQHKPILGLGLGKFNAFSAWNRGSGMSPCYVPARQRELGTGRASYSRYAGDRLRSNCWRPTSIVVSCRASDISSQSRDILRRHCQCIPGACGRGAEWKHREPVFLALRLRPAGRAGIRART